MSQLLIQLVKHNGFMKDMQKELNISNEQLEARLEQIQLHHNSKRRIFCWKLQLLAEKMVNENSAVQNTDLNDMIVREWNTSHRIKITGDIVSAFFDRSLLANDKQRHAFTALCSGDFESYKIYADEDPTLFSELLIRFLVYFLKEYAVRHVYESLLRYFFNEEAVRIGKKTLGRLDFYMRSGKPLQHNIESLVENLPLSETVFAEGMKSILLPVAKTLAKEDKEIETLFQAINKDTPEGPAAPLQEVNDTQGEKARESAESTEKNQAGERSVSEQIAEYAQKIVELSGQLTTPEASEQQSQQLQELKKDNQRLYAHLERMQEEKEQLQYKKLLDVFETISGKSSQYLLSEIFDEVMKSRNEENSLLIGKLKNLFHYFRLVEIEPTTYGFEIGEEFEITRESLKEKFALTSPLSSSDPIIKIKILKSGWVMNGKMLVYPLVEEIVASTQK